MNTSTSLNTIQDGKVINDEVSYIVSNLILRPSLQVVLRLLGSIANTINIIVFTKLGVSDSISVSFLSLAVADLSYLVLFLMSILIGMPERNFGVKPYVNLIYVTMAVMYYALMFLDISVLITIFISVQKACCVVMPFLFKSIFTRSRSVFVVLVIYAGVCFYYSPLLAKIIIDFEPVFSPKTNATRFVINFSPLLVELFDINITISKTILPIAAQVVILVCLLLMSIYLKKASEFRQSTVSNSKTGNKLAQNNKRDSKEIRVTQAILILSVVFIISNFPMVLIYITSMSVPGFSNPGHLRNLFRLCGDISDTLFAFNSSITIFVYLKFNSKYRDKFKSLFVST